MLDASSTAVWRVYGRRSRIASGGAVALVTALVTAACTTASPPHAATPARVAPSTAAAPASPSARPIAAGPSVAFAWMVPQATLTSVPAGAKLTPLDSAASSRNGHTLYLSFEFDGGKCGGYQVVIEPAKTQMRVGIIHVPTKGQRCSAPTQKTEVELTVGIAASIGLRPVVDLATGKPVVAIAD